MPEMAWKSIYVDPNTTVEVDAELREMVARLHKRGIHVDHDADWDINVVDEEGG